MEEVVLCRVVDELGYRPPDCVAEARVRGIYADVGRNVDEMGRLFHPPTIGKTDWRTDVLSLCSSEEDL